MKVTKRGVLIVLLLILFIGMGVVEDYWFFEGLPND